MQSSECVWRDIKTAPKDGAFYIAYGSGLMWVQNQPNGCSPGEWHFDDQQRYQWLGHAHSDDREATHWMPLPAPPESKND